MALDTSSEENFNTMNSKEAKKIIENFASSNNTKNAGLDKKILAGNMDGNQIVEVKANMNYVHNLFMGKKQVQFDVEVETCEPTKEDEEEDVNFVNGTGFQDHRSGNQQGNMR